ncbi:MAG: (2Fe-2S)-binding protein [Nitrososphaerota archaeon]|nr:(2Fe-2S)-binding protein [Nitrososphaerota archaeon]
MSGKVGVRFKLNGEDVAAEMEPNQTLCDYLHDVAEKTGVKKGCDTGECGACTVLMDDKPVTSCLVLAPQVDGREVVTIEGLGTKSRPSPVQWAFVELDAVQCGYCIPGMIVTLSWILEHAPQASDSEVRRLMSGNLCRCTGYLQQVEAVRRAAKRAAAGGDPEPHDVY